MLVGGGSRRGVGEVREGGVAERVCGVGLGAVEVEAGLGVAVTAGGLSVWGSRSG